MKKIGVIIGATGGIGSSLSKELSQRDWNLYLGARNEEKLTKFAKELNADHSTLDVTKSESVKEFIKRIPVDEYEHVGVALCVGSILLKPAHITSDEEWHETINLNLNSAFYLLREVASLRDVKTRSLLFFSSAAAHVGLKNHEAIAAAKAGLAGLARSAAASYAQRALRVNVIAPGLVDTPLSDHILSKAASRKASEEMHPLGRVGQPEDISSIAAELLRPEASWITGQVISIDGGLSTIR